jgi:hypothetical protein
MDRELTEAERNELRKAMFDFCIRVLSNQCGNRTGEELAILPHVLEILLA